jgi:hypothetical protein
MEYLLVLCGVLLFALGVAALVVFMVRRAAEHSAGPEIDPAASGGPRPKPVSTDMEAQAAGGPRPKV